MLIINSQNAYLKKNNDSRLLIMKEIFCTLKPITVKAFVVTPPKWQKITLFSEGITTKAIKFL